MGVAKRVKIIMPSASIQAARQREVDELAPLVTIDTIKYDPKNDRFALAMVSGLNVSIPRSQIDEFEGISSDVLERVQVGVGGDSIELDEADIHIYSPGLLRDLLGLNAGQREGGRSRSKAKIAAARVNGAAGGRPRKAVSK